MPGAFCLVYVQELSCNMFGCTKQQELVDLVCTQGKKLLNAHRVQVGGWAGAGSGSGCRWMDCKVGEMG